MGLFSTKKTIQVSTATYNLAGDEKDRPDFLKTTMVGAILGNTPSIGEALSASYRNGPGLPLRRFPNWCRHHGFDSLSGIPRGGLNLPTNINKAVLLNYLPKNNPNQGVQIQTAEIGGADYTYWVARYMVNAHPEMLEDSYTSDYNAETNTIKIIFPDLTTYSFQPDGFDVNQRYLYVSYTLTEAAKTDPMVYGSNVDVPPGTFPNKSGWTANGTNQWKKKENLTPTPTGQPRVKWSYLIQTTNSYRIDTQIEYVQSWSDLEVLIYPQNSGNPALDSFFGVTADLGDFFPFIPVRINGQTVEEENTIVGPGFLEPCRKATKRAIRADFDNIVDKINTSGNVKDMDFIYIVFGVSLGTQDDDARRYLYEFFKEITLGQDLSGVGYRNWKLQWQAASTQNDAWNTWMANPVGPEPPRATYPAPPITMVRIASDNHQALNYDMQITWSSIEETVGSGQYKPGAKAGQSEIVGMGTEDFTQYSYTGGTGGLLAYDLDTIEHIRFWYQVDRDTWRRLDIHGLKHTNMVYAGKSIEVTAMEALAKPEDSGFIIPLQEELYKRVPLKVATQMAGACAYLVINCYTIVKQKWYQTGWFKVILIVAVIVITVVTYGGGAVAAGGILGSSATVGAAIGFTGTAALIAGAIANAVAAMILTQIISMGARAIFGDKIGAIVGVIASVVALQVGSSLASGATLSSSFSSLMDAPNLMKLTMAAGDGYSQFQQASAAETMAKAQDVIKDYTQQSQAIEKQMNEFLGSQDHVDMSVVAEAVTSPIGEPPSVFLERTLMTGSDIADMSIDLIGRFSDVTLSTELPA
jgi:hypothetical protein